MPSLNQTHIDDGLWKDSSVFLDDQNRVRIHYIDSSPVGKQANPKTILLIHGFPQTSYQWRHVITPLSNAGYRVIAPDYRGAGSSAQVKDGYDKHTLSRDLHQLVHDKLGIKEKIHVVGQDIGGMVAHAYAAQFPEHLLSVMWGECPLPGAKPYENGFKHSPGVWHFTFHQQLDLPEALTYGRERMYIKHFFDRLCVNPNGIAPRDVDHYALLYSQPGALRCGFEVYRAFPQDAEDNQKLLKQNGKSKVPCAAINGDGSFLSPIAEEQTAEFYENYEIIKIENSGHWFGEENPPDTVEKILGFIRKHDG